MQKKKKELESKIKEEEKKYKGLNIKYKQEKNLKENLERREKEE